MVVPSCSSDTPTSSGNRACKAATRQATQNTFENNKKSSRAGNLFGSQNRADDNNYYRILQVSPSATEKQIKHAYGKLAKVLHPDVDPSPKARKEFDKVTKAYKTLIDPQLRKAYDAGGASFAEATAKSSSQNNNNKNSHAENLGFDPSGQNVIMQGSPSPFLKRSRREPVSR